jgi:DmsE family decaheme c-type cytochrome
MTSRLRYLTAALALLLGAAAARATQGTAAPPPAPADEKVDAALCATCHDTALSSAFKHSRHAGLDQSCGSCHAGSAAHAKAMSEGNTDGPKPSVKAMKPAEINRTCLSCHEKGNQATWMGGAHDRRGVSCTSCHSVHDFKSAKAQLKTTRDAENCFSCHQNIRGKTMRTSHHPVREGRMDCASCHNPHDSSRPKMIKADWVTDACLSCHTEKRGPFLWEHAPVRENCAHCHDPHGSNHDKMLVAKQPFLCQRCHLNTRHPGTLYDGTNTVGGPSVSNRAVEHACKNCHQNVHGGNAPSGPYLGR